MDPTSGPKLVANTPVLMKRSLSRIAASPTRCSLASSSRVLRLVGRCSLVFAAIRWSADREWTAGARKGRERTAASREWMSDNQGYGESPEIQLVRRAWDALIRGGPEVLGEVMAPDAQWYGVEEGQLCDGRKAIIDMMSRNLAGRLRGRIEEPSKMGRA
jgi:hypothetical protein